MLAKTTRIAFEISDHRGRAIGGFDVEIRIAHGFAEINCVLKNIEERFANHYCPAISRTGFVG